MQITKQQIKYVQNNLQHKREGGWEYTTIRKIKDTAQKASAFKDHKNVQARIRMILNLPELQATCTLVGSTVMLNTVLGEELRWKV